MDIRFGNAILTVSPEFKVGDPMPDGYIDREEWAKVHMDAGLKQEECCHCIMWHFPHQLSDRVKTSKVIKVSGRGRNHKVEKVTLTERICLECATKLPK